MPGFVWLVVAVVAEVTGTVSLKLSEGFTKLAPSLLVVLGYGVAFVALSMLLKAGMPVGIAYALWSAAGVALVAVIGWLFLAEAMNWAVAAGLVLVIGGVVLLEVGQAA